MGRGYESEKPVSGQGEKSYPSPRKLGPIRTYGRRIQRALRLMAQSTPSRRHTVKVLFYGQSITEQVWWKEVAQDLHRRFPHANLLIENRAIGGHSSQLLVKTAETDVYPFYPDLLIFHAYGSHIEYENLIRRVRERTTADILIQTDHITRDEHLTEETDPKKLMPDGRVWDAFMNHKFLPEIARKYGCELADVRALWKEYLRDYNLNASQLLSDAVHLNDWGCYLMAQCVKAYLRVDRSFGDREWRGRVVTFIVGKDVHWRRGKLMMEFEGNRVDALCRGNAAEVFIDGKPPSRHSSLYTLTRPTPYPGSNWPCILRVQRDAPLLEEEWVLRLTEVSPDGRRFRFVVAGSQTGADGEGSSDQRFVSHSRRVVIEPEDWNLEYAHRVFGKRIAAGFEIRWRVVPMFRDSLAEQEGWATLAQGLSGRHHTLEIRGDASAPISALRIYCPPLLRG